ncbi:sucrose-6-phosphate hydrolase [Citrobacter sp. JGM124]|uniref:glycoside hydrolase family 32 protein n=1 Tax=Citrobacter sp. JGM124 TaxID=2799789 RepID=UPI001BAB1066|nr:sucrose-6-phosphate hydrolase [Citrobacter sp. JGM124]MBS0848317.1 sucrose-6-phosphate hydrolase [Citrobacter sp. JGM124]
MANNRLEHAQQILNKYQAIAHDPFRPAYHISPKFGLLNDPNGLIQFNGHYHIFYQWNPFACDHRQKFWGHYISADLINWQEVSPALAPDTEYDANGCYSGSAFVYHDELYLFYTGNLKYGADQQHRASSQCLAKSKNGIDFEKIGIVIDGQPAGYTSHFRDPKIWQEGALFFAVIGGQTDKLQGQVLLYRSENLTEWQFLGAIAGSGIAPFDDFGYMWECPDLFRLNQHWVMLASPQGLAPQGMKYQNIYQSGYLVGDLNLEDTHFSTQHFEELDRGFEFYAPQSFVDNQGRRIMLAWMGLPEENRQPTVESHWLHQMTLPRELTLHNNRLYQNPVPELKALRQSHITYQNTVFDGTRSFNGVAGDCYELRAEFINLTSDLSLKLRSNGKDQYTLLHIDPRQNIITLDRNHAGSGDGGIRQCQIASAQSLELVIYMDKSSLEIFINQGAEVFSARIFPAASSTGISFESNAPCHLMSLDYFGLQHCDVIQ